MCICRQNDIIDIVGNSQHLRAYNYTRMTDIIFKQSVLFCVMCVFGKNMHIDKLRSALCLIHLHLLGWFNVVLFVFHLFSSLFLFCSLNVRMNECHATEFQITMIDFF